MSKRKKHKQKEISDILIEMAKTVPVMSLTIGEILELLGKRGLYILSMILTVPFLMPVSIPGTSAPFGIMIALIGLSILLNKKAWFPNKLINFRLKRNHLILILERGSKIFLKIEKWTDPRLYFLTINPTMRVLNGIFLIMSAILLTLPLPLPFSNTLPAYGVLFLATGGLEKDGLLIIFGYLMLILTLMYLALVTIFGVKGLKLLMFNFM